MPFKRYYTKKNKPTVFFVRKETNICLARHESTGSSKEMFTKTNYMGGTEIISDGHTKGVIKNKKNQKRK